KCWLAVGLMFLNWLIEAGKWKLLLHPLEAVSLKQALRAVLGGLAIGVNTPNRIGEYSGRALYVSEGKRMRSVSLAVVCSFSQLLVTLFFGSLGLLFIEQDVTGWYGLVQAGMGAITLLCTCLYFRLGWIVSTARKIKLPA